MVLSLRDRLIYNIKDNKMKLRQQQITRAEQILSDLERKVEQIEERAFNSYNSKEYVNFDLEKDLRSLQAMLDDLREEIENEQKI